MTTPNQHSKGSSPFCMLAGRPQKPSEVTSKIVAGQGCLVSTFNENRSEYNAAAVPFYNSLQQQHSALVQRHTQRSPSVR
mmetsp:Transcript_8898/g.12183  ORF Transcript_8898/g.12183 Transcript_8898/m.12183 type:complete len:80 (-) Transcript_8898:623-862(-)